jgi:fructokinase
VRIGVDVGGTKIEVVALGEGGRVLFRRRMPTPRSYGGTVGAIAALVAEAEAETGRRGSVGVGIPGTISPATGRVKNANSTWLIGRPLDRDLEVRLGRPVRMSNDANCFALSEATDGAAAGAASVFGVILGTGVGGGVVLDGRVLEGASRIAGEWGHNPLPAPRDDERPGPLCYCGKRGCVETFLSGPAIEREYLAGSSVALSAEQVAAAAAAGGTMACAVLARHAERLARSLAVVVNVLDPEVVVLGGGVSNISGLAERAQELLPAHVFSDEVATRVVRNEHGDSSGVRGAAWLWAEGEGAGS